MSSKQLDALLKSKILVAVILVAMFLLGVIQLLQGTLDKQAFRARIQQVIQEHAGKNVAIRGDISLVLLPSPMLYLPDVEIKDVDTLTPEPGLSAEMIAIGYSFATIFSEQPEITHISIERPVLTVERAHDDVIRWGWLGNDLLKAIGNPLHSISVSVDNGRIRYHSVNSGTEIDFRAVEFDGNIGQQPKLSGSFLLNERNVSFVIDSESMTGDNRMSMNIRVASGEDSIAMDGAIHMADTPEAQGRFKVDIKNMLDWVKAEDTGSHRIMEKISNASVDVQKENKVLPLMLVAKWEQKGHAADFEIEDFKGFNSAGTGKISLAWDDAVSRIQSKFVLSSFDYGQWEFFLGRVVAQQNSASASYARAGIMQGVLPHDINLKFDLEANQIFLRDQVWQNATISAVMENAVVTVNRLTMDMPGESSLSMFGVVSHSTAKGLRFEGSMESEGKSLRKLMTVFDASALELPEGEIEDYSIKSNLYIASDQVRLSEADVRISNLRLNGGMVAFFEGMPRLEADIKLRNINLDYFRDTWRAKHANSNNAGFFLKFDKSQSYNWLKRLGAIIDFRFNIEGFTFLDKKGTTATFKLLAKPDEIGIYNAHLYYPDDAMEASLSLNVQNEIPAINVMLNSNVFDIGYLLPNDQATPQEKQPQETRWSQDLFDMSWMDGLSGVFDISVGSFIYKDMKLSNLKFRAKLNDNMVTLQGVSFGYWQGRCAISGSFFAGKVPGVSIGFTLYNAELKDILKALASRDTISGKVSVSGNLSTSGVNFLSWVSQADSEIVFTGRGVRANGFNLQGVVDAVAVSRTAADVLNNVNLVLLKGSTDFNVEGNLNVKSGVMRTPGIVLKTGNISGSMAGSVKLVPWTMEMTALYQFPMMTSEKTPTMTMQFIGPLENPEMHVDTASLEAYVAKRITGTSAGR